MQRAKSNDYEKREKLGWGVGGLLGKSNFAYNMGTKSKEPYRFHLRFVDCN